MNEQKQKARFTKDDLITFIILFLLGTTIFLLVFLLNSHPGLVSACDGAFAAGVSIIAALGLQVLSRLGAFDTFGYSFSLMVASFSPKVEKKYRDLFEYKNIKAEKRSNRKLYFVSYLIVGLGFITAALILSLVYNQVVAL